MAERYTLFGSSESLEDVADACAQVIGRAPTLHDSDYFSEYYRWPSCGDGEVEVKRNVADDDGSPYEPDFGEWPVLVYESGSSGAASALAGIDILVLLRDEWL